MGNPRTRVPGRPLGLRWWLLLLLFLGFFIPAFTEHPYDPVDTTAVVAAVLRDPLVMSVPVLLPVAKLLLLTVAVIPFLLKDPRVSGRIVTAYYAAILVIVGVGQNISTTDEFGFSWLIGNTVLQLVVAGWCARDAFRGRTSLDIRGLRRGRLWLLVPMALSALMPYSIENEHVIPSLAGAFDSEAGVTYCMITPVVLGIFLLFPDQVDRGLLSVVSFVALLFGLINMAVWFGVYPADWWMGVLHIPLVITAVYAVAESGKGLGDLRARGRRKALNSPG